jgi:hypothetical protein
MHHKQKLVEYRVVVSVVIIYGLALFGLSSKTKLDYVLER